MGSSYVAMYADYKSVLLSTEFAELHTKFAELHQQLKQPHIFIFL